VDHGDGELKKKGMKRFAEENQQRETHRGEKKDIKENLREAD